MHKITDDKTGSKTVVESDRTETVGGFIKGRYNNE